MAAILIVDDEAVVREAVAASLVAEGHAVRSTADVATARLQLRARTPNVILLDLALPGENGLAFLRELRESAETAGVPILVLTSRSDKATVLQAANLKVQGYLLKSAFSMNDLLARIKRLLAPATRSSAATASQADPSAPAAVSIESSGSCSIAELPPLLKREECINFIKQATQGKTFGGIVAQVIAMAGSPSSDLGDLGYLIGRDPVLSARLLQVANSSAFASKKQTFLTIPDAVRQIGCTAICELAATMGIFNALWGQDPSHADQLRCWQHSLTVAHLCQHLAAISQPEQARRAYLIGLCHDLGDILLHTHFSGQLADLREVHTATGLPLGELEQQMLGIRRYELADLMLEQLGLPAAIRVPIQSFHRQATTPQKEISDPLGRLLRLADSLANGMLLASDNASLIGLVTVAEYRKMTGQDAPALPEVETLRSSMTVLTGMLARLSSAQLMSLIQPSHPKRPVRVWLAKHSTVATSEPVTLAIRMMAEAVDVFDRLPSAQEAAGYSHVVILAPSVRVKGFDANAVSDLFLKTPPSPLWIVSSNEVPSVATNGAEPVGAISLDQLAKVLAPLNVDAAA